MSSSSFAGDTPAPPRRYPTVVVDPPWEQKGGPLKGGHGEGFVGTAESLALPYPTMKLQEIGENVLVPDWATPDAHMYLWTTNAHVTDAFKLCAYWGFRYSTLCVWAKNTMGGGLGGDAFGISTEFLRADFISGLEG